MFNKVNKVSFFLFTWKKTSLSVGFFVFDYGEILRVSPLDTGRKLNVHTKFRRSPGRLLHVLSFFNIRPVSRGLDVGNPFVTISKRKVILKNT